MNRAAADDNMLVLMQLAALPLANPPSLPHLRDSGQHGSKTR
jgi:hypothetical protein